MNETKRYFWMECVDCGKKVYPEQIQVVCPNCGQVLLPKRDFKGFLKDKVFFRRDYIGRFPTTAQASEGSFEYWKHLLLPGISNEFNFPYLGEGFTPWQKVRGNLVGSNLKNMRVKHLGENPSKSFKDYGMAALMAWVKWQIEKLGAKIKALAGASTGDTAASAAKAAAVAEIEELYELLSCIIILPHGRVSVEQIVQSLNSGARVFELEHPEGFDACMRFIRKFLDSHPEYIPFNSLNSWRLVGQEAIGLEIWMDYDFSLPDWVSIVTGNGGNITSLLSTFLILRELGYISRLPGIIIGQNSGSDTLVRWYKSGFTVYEPRPIQGNTPATAAFISNPVSFPRIRKLLPKFDRVLAYRVRPEEIFRTWMKFSRAGIDLCPQGSISADAALQAEAKGEIKKGEEILILNTAASVKFSRAASEYHQQPGAPEANKSVIIKGDDSELAGEIERYLIK
jgi:threonine synthase